MSNMQDSDNPATLRELVMVSSPLPRPSTPATLRDLVMTSSPLLRPAQRFVAPAPPAPQIHDAGINHTAAMTKDSLEPAGNSRELIPSGPANSAAAGNRSTIQRDNATAQNAIVVPGKHVALFIAALDRMAQNNWVVPQFGNYKTGGTQALVQNPNGFTPTTMARYGPGVQRPATAGQQLLAQFTNMSPNYRGDPANIHNYSLVFLPNCLNTSFWIEDLPANVLLSELLGGITDCGRIFAVHINNERARELGYAAAKLIFIDLEGARRFYYRYMVPQLLIIRGMWAFIVHNRIKVAEQSGLSRYVSRCIEVTGLKTLVHMKFLAIYFDGLFKYEIDCTVEHPHQDPAMTTLEIRFGSFRAQAQMAFKVLTTEPIFVDNGVKVVYARDPCDRQN